MSGGADAVFEARGITKVYRLGEVEVHALRGVDLALAAGELVVLLGPSGSGKSTLLNILGGLDVPTAGRVSWRGRDLTDAGEAELTEFRRRHIGFVFQFYNLIPSLTARENVALVADITDDPMTPEEALERVGLGDRLDHFPAQLSGGQQQRVAIARALAKRPDVLLCDEPTGALDIATGIVVLEAIERVYRELGTTVVVITHNAAIAAMADRVITMADGRIAAVQRTVERRAPREVLLVNAMLSMLDRKLLRDLLQMKGQALAIALVIGVGVAMFVMYRSTFDSLAATRAGFYERSRFADVFASARRAPEGLRRRVAAIPGVAAAETRVVADVTLDLPGLDEPAVGRLVSIPAGREPRLNAVTLLRGRLPGGRGLGAGRDEVLVAESFALAHELEPGDTLAATLNGRRRRLTVTGIALSAEYVFSVRPGDLLPDPDRFGVLWMERRALAAAFDLEGSFNDLALQLAPGASEDEVIARLDRLLAPYGGTGAIARSLQTSHWYLENELTQLANVGSFLPLLFLGVAAFLLHVVLARIVAVQREQIAALKALGYADRTLAGHYIKLALAIAAVGAAGGLLLGAKLGAGLNAIYGELYRFPESTYALPPGRAAQAVAVALAAAALGALGGVRNALALPPAEAMRPEAPASYRESLLERLGLRRLLPPPARMILRTLGRRPGRTAVAVGGIAVAGALVILGSALRDGVARLLDEQLGVIQRQDATVTFTEPAAARAVHELERLPGVVRVEPFRSVAVRLRAGHRARRVAITGLAAGAELRRVVGASGRVVELPPAGLVLSSALADLLGVAEGDLVTVEVLEGARPVRRLPVARLVEEHMGTAAYLELGAVHRLLREGRTLSGAYLEIEPSAAPAVYRRLKDTPRVAAVARSAAFLESFEENFARNLEVMVKFTLGFAVLIAFGVVYHNARISLAERGRELASLRVLGFRRREVSLLFLGELAVVTLAALPLAALLGWGLAALALSAFSTELYRFPLALARRTFALAELTLILSALVSGLVVRRRLDRLDLVAVLKTRE